VELWENCLEKSCRKHSPVGSCSHSILHSLKLPSSYYSTIIINSSFPHDDRRCGRRPYQLWEYPNYHFIEIESVNASINFFSRARQRPCQEYNSHLHQNVATKLWKTKHASPFRRRPSITALLWLIVSDHLANQIAAFPFVLK